MSTNVANVVSFFPGAQNGFTTTTAGTVASGATSVALNSIAGYTNGQPAVMVIDPSDATKKQTFTGIVDTAGIQLTSVVWTAGTNQIHALGATVVDYATATHIAMISKGILVGHTQKGNHKTLTDDNGNEWVGQTSAASAVNYVNISNSATGNGVTIAALGDDTNIDLLLTTKGTGIVKINGNPISIGAWTVWTPSWTNLTVGNGTTDAAYSQDGKTIKFRLKFTLGSTSAVGTNPIVAFPVAPKAVYSVANLATPIGHFEGYDTSATARFYGIVSPDTTAGTSLQPLIYSVSGAIVAISGFAATSPFTWAVGDVIWMEGEYEAA